MIEGNYDMDNDRKGSSVPERQEGSDTSADPILFFYAGGHFEHHDEVG